MIVTSAEAAPLQRMQLPDTAKHAAFWIHPALFDFGLTLRTFRWEDIAAHQVIVTPVLM